MAEEKKVKAPGGPGGRGPKVENPGKIFKRLFGFMMESYRIPFIIVVICIIAAAFAGVQSSMFSKTLIDEYITPLLGVDNPDFGPLLKGLASIACVYLVGIVTSYAYNRIMVNITQGTLRNIREKMFKHMESLPIKYFDTHAHGDIMSMYTNDIDTLRQLISQSIPQLINSVITIVMVFISMVILSIPLTILTLVMVAVMMVCTRHLAGKSGMYFGKQQRDLGKLNGYIEEMMGGQKVVKVFCHEEKALEEFRELNEKLRDSANNANAYANILMPVNAQLGNVSYVLCAVVGAILAIGSGSGVVTVGTLVAFLQLNKSFNMPITQVSQQLNSVVMAMAGAERIFNLLDEQPETDEGTVTLVNVKEDAQGKLVECKERTEEWAWKTVDKETGKLKLVKLEGDVEFKGVDFGYTDEKIVLHDIKMFATPGQKLAFVGSTGAGKTTITNLINRFYDIQDGKNC